MSCNRTAYVFFNTLLFFIIHTSFSSIEKNCDDKVVGGDFDECYDMRWTYGNYDADDNEGETDVHDD